MANKKTFPFTYTLKDEAGEVCKHGKGTVPKQSEEALVTYFRRRGYSWDSADVEFHPSEDSALKTERLKDEQYIATHGKLPRGAMVRGGGGRRTESRCKARLRDGTRCRYKPLAGNYGYCGVHR